MVMNIVEQHFPGAIEENAYVTSTAATLASIGFTAENSAPVLSICRDEICASFSAAVQRQWGNFFTLGGLGGLPFGGRTGIAAASLHAPDIYDRQRLVIYALTHIGIGPEGEIGGCVLPGMEHLNGACGALIAYTGQLNEGSLDTRVFSDDAEFDLLKHRMSKLISQPPADLLTVTNAALEAIQQDIEMLTGSVLDNGKCDYAVFTGTQIHLPDQHLVRASESWVVQSGSRQAINFQNG